MVNFRNEKWLHAMKSIPSYFRKNLMKEVANCEQLSPFSTLKEFLLVQRHENSSIIPMLHSLRMESPYFDTPFFINIVFAKSAHAMKNQLFLK
jgi:hypothetical protein